MEEPDWSEKAVQNAVRIVIWNIRWRRINQLPGRTLYDLIARCDPDVICITEGHTDFFRVGNIITSDANYGYPLRDKRRKVLLWSKSPWRQVDAIGSDTLPPGRFVSGETVTSAGPIRFLGVCVPWRDAHVATGRRDRLRWEEHMLYLDGLSPLLRSQAFHERTIILGDFNQKVPGTDKRAKALSRALGERFDIATRDDIPDVQGRSIDHLAHTQDLDAVSVKGLSNRTDNGVLLTDHFGLVIDLRPC